MRQDNISYQITEGVLARPIGDSIVLFHPETERLLTVSGCGTRIWELLLAAATPVQIVDHLTAEFDGPEAVIRDDVTAFLSQLEAERIIQRDE